MNDHTRIDPAAVVGGDRSTRPLSPAADLAFVNLVEQMRIAQKQYFQTRSSSVMATAKQLEREVDKAIGEIRRPQQKLFEEA